MSHGDTSDLIRSVRFLFRRSSRDEKPNWVKAIFLHEWNQSFHNKSLRLHMPPPLRWLVSGILCMDVVLCPMRVALIYFFSYISIHSIQHLVCLYVYAKCSSSSSNSNSGSLPTCCLSIFGRHSAHCRLHIVHRVSRVQCAGTGLAHMQFNYTFNANAYKHTHT